MSLVARCETKPSSSLSKPESPSRPHAHRLDSSAEYVIANWARWCKDESGIYPHCPTNWELMDDIQYKNCHVTAEEKMEILKRQEPIREREAERVELWVRQFAPLHQQALRTHYIQQCDGQRRTFHHLTDEDWQIRRARWTQMKLRERGHPQKVDVDIYEQAVNEAMRQVGECLVMWARGV